MAQTILEQNISSILGIDTLSQEEQAAFLAEVGDVIFQTVLVRLVSSLTEEQQHALEAYLETEPEPDVLLQHLFVHYKEFKSILEDAVLEFKEDAAHVLGQKSEQDITIIDA